VRVHATYRSNHPLPAPPLGLAPKKSQAPTAPAADVRTLSFATLARTRLVLLIRALVDADLTIGDKTVPHDPALRGARKIVLRLRTHLDLFAHAFGKANKAFRKLRRLLDWGYEAIGRFKDLFDAHRAVLTKPDPQSGELVRVHASRVPFAELDRGGFVLAKPDDRTGKLCPLKGPLEYPRRTLEKRRSEMLTWKGAMTEVFTQHLDEMLIAIDEPKPNRPKRKDLSKFFWGGVDVSPRADKTGVENLQRLTRSLIDRALEELPRVEALATPVGRANEQRFHDFRKRLRAIWSVLDEFPEVSDDPTRMQLLREGLFGIVSRYGDVETMVVGWDLARKQGKPKKELAALASRAEDAWKNLRAFQQDGLELAPLLLRLKQSLSAP
jgi:hypothetical protein